MKKNDNTLLWLLGGGIAAFGAYELFLKPKTTVSAAVAPVSGSNATLTTAKLPTGSPLTALNNLAQTVANAINPQPMTYNPGPTNTLAPSNFYVDTPPAQIDPGTTPTPIYSPSPVDDSAKQAYDSAMYAQYQQGLANAQLSGMFYKFEV